METSISLWGRRFGEVFGCALTLLVVTTTLQVRAASYPVEGRTIEWKQPGGTKLKLRVFGDDHYARTTTESGYTVLFVPEGKSYVYAVLSADGKSLEPSRVPAEQTPPAGLPKDLRDSSEKIATVRRQNEHLLENGARSAWEARKRAVQEQRLREESAKAAANSATKDAPAAPK